MLNFDETKKCSHLDNSLGYPEQSRESRHWKMCVVSIFSHNLQVVSFSLGCAQRKYFEISDNVHD